AQHRGVGVRDRPAVVGDGSGQARATRRSFLGPRPGLLSQRRRPFGHHCERPETGPSRTVRRDPLMKVIVIGGTGLIGTKLVATLRAQGHDVEPAAPSTGVDTLTGEGLDDVLAGADVVVDVSNSPSFADDDVMRFFVTSTTNLLRAEQKAGVGH